MDKRREHEGARRALAEPGAYPQEVGWRRLDDDEIVRTCGLADEALAHLEYRRGIPGCRPRRQRMVSDEVEPRTLLPTNDIERRCRRVEVTRERPRRSRGHLSFVQIAAELPRELHDSGLDPVGPLSLGGESCQALRHAVCLCRDVGDLVMSVDEDPGIELPLGEAREPLFEPPEGADDAAAEPQGESEDDREARHRARELRTCARCLGVASCAERALQVALIEGSDTLEQLLRPSVPALHQRNRFDDVLAALPRDHPA